MVSTGLGRVAQAVAVGVASGCGNGGRLLALGRDAPTRDRGGRADKHDRGQRQPSPPTPHRNIVAAAVRAQAPSVVRLVGAGWLDLCRSALGGRPLQLISHATVAKTRLRGPPAAQGTRVSRVGGRADEISSAQLRFVALSRTRIEFDVDLVS